MSRIDRVRLKIERAKEHILNLDVAIRCFRESKPYVLGTKEKPEILNTALYVARINSIPHSVPLILGDAVHNLRSVLDHLTWQLVEAGGGIPDERAMFPICQTSEQYASALKRGKIKGVHPKAEQLICDMQPYMTGDQTLWHINTLDIADKHRLVVTVALVYKGWEVNTLGSGNILEFPQGRPYSLVAGDEIVNLPSSTYKRENHENFKLAIDIAFGESEVVAGEPVLESVNKMADFVGSVISMFEPFLV